MKNDTFIEGIQGARQAFESDAGITEIKNEGIAAGMPEPPPQKKGLRRIWERLPALPRSSDPAQRRAGGNLIKFMAALLALTLIARGTSGATLAKVTLETPSRSEIADAVTGNATVSARDSLDISAPEGLTIMEMLAGAGQTVKNGSPVARFDMDEVREKLAVETANLDKLLLDLDKLERNDAADATSLENAQRSLARAREDYNTTKAQGEADVVAAKETLDKAWAKLADDPDAAALDNARRSLMRAQEDYAAVNAQGMADVAIAQAALDEALRNRADPPDSTALDNAERSLRRAIEDYNNVKAQGDADIASARAALTNAQNNQNAKYQEWNNAADEDKPAAEQAYNAARAETERAQSALETAQSKAQDNLTSAGRKVEDAEASMAKAEQDYDKSSKQASDAIQTAIDKAWDALDSAKKKADDNLASSKRKVEDAEISLAKAEQDYDKSARQSADTATQNSLSAISLRFDIEAKKELVDALRLLEANDGILYSELEGVVSSAMAEGGKTGKDSLISFVDAAKGFEARLQLDKSVSDKLAVGDECQVTTGGGNMYFTPTVTGTISAISLPDEQDRVKVTVNLPDGNWTAGQRVDVQAVQDRSTYDLCVPLSALRSDSSGYYLLLVEQRNTVLGIENVVVSAPVTVLASDDEMAAVRGPVDRNSQVVTGSSKAVAAGDRVRADN